MNTKNIKNEIEERYINQFYGKHMLYVDLQADLMTNIMFPSVPYNLEMLLSKIDFPPKADKNPNGSLFMDPAKINANNADDIGVKYFGGLANASKILYTMTLRPSANESYVIETENIGNRINSVFNMLFEDTENGRGSGKYTAPKDIKAHNDKCHKASLQVYDAISKYVTDSIAIISPIVELVAGQNNVKESLSKFKKTISLYLSASEKTIEDLLEKRNLAIKEIGRDETRETQKQLNDMLQHSDILLKFNQCVYATQKKRPADKRDEYNYRLNEIVQKSLKLNQYDNIYKTIIGSSEKKFAEWYDKHEDEAIKVGFDVDNTFKLRSLVTNNESLYYDEINRLFEDDELALDNSYERSKAIDYTQQYRQLFEQLSASMNEVIGPTAEWSCMKDLSTNMTKLKERADEEIKKKIELVCKTGANTKSLVKHPMKAEGLLTMWSRYSSELQLRIENRINQLTGSNGSVGTGSATMVREFLTNTYPSIIAAMLVYRSIFKQISDLYKGDYIPQMTLDAIEQQIIDSVDSQINNNILGSIMRVNSINTNTNA